MRRSGPIPASAWAVGFAVFAAGTALRPQLLAIGPLAPRISNDLGISHAAVGTIGAASLFLLAVASPIGPTVVARLGPRKAMGGCLALLVVAGVARAFAPSFESIAILSGVIGLLIGAAQSVPAHVVREAGLAPRIGSATFTVGLVGSSVAGAALAVPLAAWLDGWRPALAVLALLGLAALVIWLAMVRADGPRPAARAGGRLPRGDRAVLRLAVAFGLQGVVYHALVAWLPAALIERGMDEAAAGSYVGWLNVLALGGSLAVLLVGERLGSLSHQLIAVSATTLLGVAALAAGFDSLAAVSIIGASLGVILPVIVALPLERTADGAQAAAQTALVFLIGYGISGLGPIILGAVRDVSGSFDAGLWILAAAAAALVVVALAVLRDTGTLHGFERGSRRSRAHVRRLRR